MDRLFNQCLERKWWHRERKRGEDEENGGTGREREERMRKIVAQGQKESRG
jgi:predicted transcriptional regulator